MTFDDVLDNYEAQRARNKKEWREYMDSRAGKEGKPYTGFWPIYTELDAQLIQAAKDEFGFNDAQARFIYSETYDRYHAYYSDMPYGMKRLCQFIADFKKIDA